MGKSSKGRKGILQAFMEESKNEMLHQGLSKTTVCAK